MLPTSQVFVPLTGELLDLIRLHAQGHRVPGVELPQLAVQQFVAGNDLQATTRVSLWESLPQ